MKNYSIVLGSFFGDEGKGQCVNNLCNSLDKDSTCVLRFSGGPQVGHNVSHNGIQHCFSNYGSGTLLDIPTYWSDYCLVDPFTAILEKDILLSKGITPNIIYSPMCEIITPFDVWNQWNNNENRKHGTVGVGIKSTLDRIKNGYHLKLMDALNLCVLREKIKSIQDNYYKISENLPTAKFSIDVWVLKVNEFIKNIELLLPETIFKRYDNIIFEGSQGILLDQTFGVMPWCTPSNTTSKNAVELIKNYSQLPLANVKVYYVCRPYITRHGNGPLLTTSKVLDVEDKNNTYNEYQKSFRSCEFDINLLNHSLYIDSFNFKEKHEKNIVFSHASELSSELKNKICNLIYYLTKCEKNQTLHLNSHSSSTSARTNNSTDVST